MKKKEIKKGKVRKGKVSGENESKTKKRNNERNEK